MIVLSCTKKELATVKTNSDYIVTNNSAKIKGLIKNDGGSSIVSKGICLSSKETPTILDTVLFDSSVKLQYEVEFNDLLSNKTYFVRAFVKNVNGLSYGDIIKFSTKQAIINTKPTVVTDSVSSITKTSISAVGTVKNDGGYAVTSRGFCWGLSSSPTITDNKTNNGFYIGSFSSNIQGLTPNTTYYLRSYATNSIGTSYGNQIVFTTSNIYLPTVSTNSISSISNNSVTCNGVVSSDGGTQVLSKGFCWSKSNTLPTLNDNSIVNGTGVGTFTSQISGLTLNTVYYIRAFATNSKGTQYGQVLKFTTTINVGDSYQGGRVAYILQNGDQGYISGQKHGIIAATSDQSSGIQWYNGSYTITNASGTSIGTGNSNTNTIVSFQGAGSYAAKLCSDLVLGGYSDWYLPSKNELNKLYLSRSIIGGFNSTDLSYYWSSSEYSNIYSIVLQFSTGTFYIGAKDSGYMLVRAIRSF